MNNKPGFVYWDSCVFLSYINGPSDRTPILEQIWDDIKAGNGFICTSMLSVTEVSFAESERGGLDASMEEQIESYWHDPSIMLIEYHIAIAEMSRSYIRMALSQGLRLRPADAVHLATAKWFDRTIQPISELNTYDPDILRLGTMAGMRICVPHVPQRTLF